MLKTTLTLLLVSGLLLTVQACASSVPSTSDPKSINTAVAQTLAAALMQTLQPGIPVIGRETQVTISYPRPNVAQDAILCYNSIYASK